MTNPQQTLLRFNRSSIYWSTLLILFLISKYVWDIPLLRRFLSNLAYDSLYVIPSATFIFLISYAIIDTFKLDNDSIKSFCLRAMHQMVYYYLAVIVFAGSSFFVPALRAITCSRNDLWRCTVTAIKSDSLLFGIIIASVYLFASLFDHRRKKYLGEID